MITKIGKYIIDCGIGGNCATCAYNRNWSNTVSIKEDEDGYCDYHDVTVEEE